MKVLTCNFENCYGIKKFNYDFDFSKSNVIALYARNGVMKTSFAKTFKKIQDGKVKDVKDEIFDLNGKVEVLKDGTEKIESSDVFVIKTFENYYESESVASLLVDDKIKKHINIILDMKSSLFKDLEKLSGLKKIKTIQGKKTFELEPTIMSDFMFEENSFLLNIKNLEKEKYYCDFSNIKYNDIFDKSVLNKIKDKHFQEKLEEFCLQSNKIYEYYGFLDKGNFTLPKLKNISKLLKTSNFFVKNNCLYLEGDIKIENQEKLESKIKEIETEIKKVPEFKEIEKLLSDSKGMVLKEIIENNPEIIEYLKIDKHMELKKQLWLSYLETVKEKFIELSEKYEELENKFDLNNLEDTDWNKALDIFEERFTVPYKMRISNIKGAIIGENMPVLEFLFENDDEIVKMNRNELESIDVLSRGEKRALYLLNIIFDIERIKKTEKETLFIIDDIADSFDYKNKYAIVEYLYEMAKEKNFKLLILSHNFDFYRTVSMRLGLDRTSKLCAGLCNEEIIISEEKYQNQPFKAWKKDMSLINVIALIPFVRNLIEYGRDEKVCDIKGIDNDYLLLTNLLHKKDISESIKFDQLKKIYEKYLGRANFNKDIDLDSFVIMKLEETAREVKNSDVDLEYKVLLSIAIRYKAEKFMLKEISKFKNIVLWKHKKKINKGLPEKFLKELDLLGNQTRELYEVYKQYGDKTKIKILDEVNIMTPENIHLNSFMYEPLLDMDINELKNLYEKLFEM